MKVKDLIKELSKMPVNLEVYLSSDGEGNTYSAYSDGCIKFTKKGRKTEWSQYEEMYDYSDIKANIKDYKPVFILYPIG